MSMFVQQSPQSAESASTQCSWQTFCFVNPFLICQALSTCGFFSIVVVDLQRIAAQTHSTLRPLLRQAEASSRNIVNIAVRCRSDIERDESEVF